MYTSVVGLLAVLMLIVYFRNRWKKSVHHYRTVIAPQNELDSLDEMAKDYRQGKYHNREYVERVIREVESNHAPSRLRDSYLRDARDALEQGRLLRRPDKEDFEAVVMDPMNEDKCEDELHQLAIARKLKRSRHLN